MGKGTDGVKASPEELEQEVREIRDDMTPVLKELDHRRHELTDWGLQMRRRGPAIMKGVAIAATLFAALKLVKRARAKRATRKRARPYPV